MNGLWDIDITLQNRGCSIYLDPVNWSAPKLHQVGTFWTYFTAISPYLRGQSTFGGYFFTRWALLHRPFNIWWQLGQKCLYRGSASMEVGLPQLLCFLIFDKKALVMQNLAIWTSGSLVMSTVVQKTSNARPPLVVQIPLSCGSWIPWSPFAT